MAVETYLAIGFHVEEKMYAVKIVTFYALNVADVISIVQSLKKISATR